MYCWYIQVSVWAKSRPQLFVPVRRRIPVPASQHTRYPDDDHLRDNPPTLPLQPAQYGLPASQPCPMDGAAPAPARFDAQYFAPSSPSEYTLRARTETAHGAQGLISGDLHRGPVTHPASPAETSRPSTSKQSSKRPAGQPVASRALHHHLSSFTSHFRNVFRPELCTIDQPGSSRSVPFEPNLTRGESSSCARNPEAVLRLRSHRVDTTDTPHAPRGLLFNTVLMGVVCFH